MNPYDLYALETALRLRDAHGGRVTVGTMGPPQAMAVVREAYMMGADEGYVFSDRRLGGADVLATSYTLSQAIPVMCLAPVFVLWFGYTTAMRVVVVILTNFFPVTINLYDGLRSARPERMELMKTWGATKGQIFRLLRFPSSLPYLFTALRIAVPWSVIAAAVAEWLGAPAGLGFYSRYCMMDMDAPGLLAPLLVLTVIALLLNGILKVLERRIVSWRGQ